MATKRTNSAALAIRETDKHGESIVRIPVTSRKGAWAVLDAADYDRLLRLGISMNWFACSARGHEYLRTTAAGATGQQLTVSRFILGAQGGQIVQYHSRNRFDLRQRNISLTKGAAKRDDCKLWNERDYDDFAIAAE